MAKKTQKQKTYESQTDVEILKLVAELKKQELTEIDLILTTCKIYASAVLLGYQQNIAKQN